VFCVACVGNMSPLDTEVRVSKHKWYGPRYWMSWFYILMLIFGLLIMLGPTDLKSSMCGLTIAFISFNTLQKMPEG